VIAAPDNDDKSVLRSACPKLWPKLNGNGSTTNLPYVAVSSTLCVEKLGLSIKVHPPTGGKL
jgi:hypothetical protein